jgi:3-methylfumaryl-CoA hydratase
MVGMSESPPPPWLEGWQPGIESRTADLSAASLLSLSALLDAPAGSGDDGQPLPTLWHWAALAEWPAAHTLGPDGHPRVGGFMPATPYPRRMWLGTTVKIAQTPTVGERVDTARVVTDVTEKTGKQGTFALVTAELTLRSSATGTLLLTERTQYAYRDAPETKIEPTPPAPTPPASTERAPALAKRGEWDWLFSPNSTMLMSFSAATANTHRIHYDTPYTRDIEGYPDLLVHGPLMAVILAEVMRRERPELVMRTFSCRALRPMYLGMQATVRSVDGDCDLDASLVGSEGAHMSAAASGKDATG